MYLLKNFNLETLASLLKLDEGTAKLALDEKDLEAVMNDAQMICTVDARCENGFARMVSDIRERMPRVFKITKVLAQLVASPDTEISQQDMNSFAQLTGSFPNVDTVYWGVYYQQLPDNAKIGLRMIISLKKEAKCG